MLQAFIDEWNANKKLVAISYEFLRYFRMGKIIRQELLLLEHVSQLQVFFRQIFLRNDF